MTNWLDSVSRSPSIGINSEYHYEPRAPINLVSHAGSIKRTIRPSNGVKFNPPNSPLGMRSGACLLQLSTAHCRETLADGSAKVYGMSIAANAMKVRI